MPPSPVSVAHHPARDLDRLLGEYQHASEITRSHPPCYVVIDRTASRVVGLCSRKPDDPMHHRSRAVIQAHADGHELVVRECPFSYHDALDRIRQGEDLLPHVPNGRTRRDTRRVDQGAASRAVGLLEAGFSLRRVAEKTGLSKSTLQRLRTGPPIWPCRSA